MKLTIKTQTCNTLIANQPLHKTKQLKHEQDAFNQQRCRIQGEEDGHGLAQTQTAITQDLQLHLIGVGLRRATK